MISGAEGPGVIQDMVSVDTIRAKIKLRLLAPFSSNFILFTPVLWLFLKLAAEKKKRYGNYDEFKEFS